MLRHGRDVNFVCKCGEGLAEWSCVRCGTVAGGDSGSGRVYGFSPYSASDRRLHPRDAIIAKNVSQKGKAQTAGVLKSEGILESVTSGRRAAEKYLRGVAKRNVRRRGARPVVKRPETSPDVEHPSGPIIPTGTPLSELDRTFALHRLYHRGHEYKNGTGFAPAGTGGRRVPEDLGSLQANDELPDGDGSRDADHDSGPPGGRLEVPEVAEVSGTVVKFKKKLKFYPVRPAEYIWDVAKQ